MDKNSTTSSSIDLPDYNLIREIQDEIDASWSSGRKIFEYKIPSRNRKLVAALLAHFASNKVKVELISEEHTTILGKISTEFKNTCENIEASFWENSRFAVNRGNTASRIIVVEGATERFLNLAIGYTSISPSAPCVILLR